ncbi:D-ribose pyranase [Priestia flexa]|jgi:D-ribose pyranase|uniref:D-ribose pyranase n=1 Tax=Priestia flexa TaxID=86664 RepID=A0A1N6RLA0_9BACI|nr:D-ribose pyranase [Priestia flexa]AQX55682.1 D-ribose pyranase [Priestia flexa]MBN8250988.1 D-ribose pyranase [Priestia flexa]MBN8433206.1 D-ribose pyranase [Priestia flexa]MBY6086101.1 D-ribose pyranase [Priestia flexa]MCA0965732.1 D-ribose pyranase [Priestia flexa]
MKRHGILNSHISKVLTDLGHTDMVVIADAGLPIPDGVPRIDLSLKLGVPSFEDVVDAVRDDMVIEKVIVAHEIKENNKETMSYINEVFFDTEKQFVSHEILKALTKEAKVVIRTGEVTPYANCILQAGVIF